MSSTNAMGTENEGANAPLQECPPAEELAAFSHGRLPETTLERIGEHVERCAACEAALESLDAKPDPVVEGLRRSRRPASDWRPNDLVGEYEILSPLGTGGMGRVWKARHRRMNREVAIKAVKQLDRNFIERFQREVEALAALSHPNIAIAYDAGEHDGHPYLVMELLQGRDLSQQLAETGPLSLPDACNCILQAARGLAFAHGRGLVHRDVKPANLFRTDEGTIKVLDLGLVRRGDQVDTVGKTGSRMVPGLTTATTVMGTLDYAAPEQTAASAAADHRADIYSLGCTFYALLCGSSPFSRPTAEQIRLAQQSEQLRPLREVRPDVPIRIERLCRRMLEKDLAKRPGSMPEVIDELQAALRPSRFWRIAVAACALAAFLVAGIVVFGRGTPRPPAIVAPVEFADAIESQRRWADYLRVPSHEANSIGMALVLVPPGRYPDGSASLERPVQVGAHETTVAAFRQFVAATGYVTEPARNKGGWVPRYNRKEGESPFLEASKYGWETPGYAITDGHPVTQVSWNDAMAFCKWLGEKEGMAYRLPTASEATWIMKSGSGTAYYFVGEPKVLLDHVWFEPNSNRRAREVGSTKPNAWGLFDTVGNVLEWTSDWLDREPHVYKIALFGCYMDREDALLIPRGLHLDRGNSFMGFRVIRECRLP